MTTILCKQGYLIPIVKELKNVKVKYVEGEYTNSMDNKVKFVLVVE